QLCLALLFGFGTLALLQLLTGDPRPLGRELLGLPLLGCQLLGLPLFEGALLGLAALGQLLVCLLLLGPALFLHLRGLALGQQRAFTLGGEPLLFRRLCRKPFLLFAQGAF